MQARVSEQNGVVIMHLMGRIDLEAMDGFRQVCSQKLQKRPVVFDFRDLSFVGSSGILPFLDVLQNFKAAAEPVFRFSHVGIEFRRLLAATPLRDIKLYDNSVLAALSFNDVNVPCIIVEGAETDPMISLDQIFMDPDLSMDETQSAQGSTPDRAGVAADSDLESDL